MPLGSLAWASAVGNRAVQRFARGRTLARLTPQEVLEQYQVEEDTVAEWSPKLGGLIPIPLAGSKVLTTTEGKLLDSLTFSRGLLGLSTFKDIAEDAFARSTSEFPDPSAIPSYELGRSPMGVSYEQLTIEYDAGHLVKAFVLRT